MLIRILGVSVISGFVLAVAAITAPETRGDPDVSGVRPCSIQTIAWAWMFATDVGHFEGVGDITAIGTMNAGGAHIAAFAMCAPVGRQ